MAVLARQWLVLCRTTSVDGASGNDVVAASQLAASCYNLPCMAVACSVCDIVFDGGASSDDGVWSWKFHHLVIVLGW